MSHIEGKNSLESLPQKSSDQGGDESRLGVHFHFGDEFIERKKHETSQSEGDGVLEEEVVEQGNRFRIDVVGDKGAFLYEPGESRPNGRDGQGDEHKNSDNGHDDVFHEPLVDKGFVEVSLEYEVDGIDQVGKEKTSPNDGAHQTEPSEIGDVLGEKLNPFEKEGVVLGEEFVRKDVQASHGNLGIAEKFCRDKSEQSDERNGRENSEIGDDDGVIGTFVISEPLERLTDDGKDRIFIQLYP